MSGPESPAPAARAELTVSWYTIALLAIALVLLSLATRGPNTLGLDLRVSDWVQQWDDRFGESLAVAGNALGYRNFGLVLLAVAWVGLSLMRLRRELWFIVILALQRLAATQLKDMFESPRPTANQVDVIGTFDSWGFPSGHVTTAAVTLGAIAWIVARQVPSLAVHRMLGMLWLAGVVISAWARIWYGAHWFTDTIGGALAGAIFVLVASNLSAMITSDRATAKQPQLTQTPTP